MEIGESSSLLHPIPHLDNPASISQLSRLRRALVLADLSRLIHVHRYRSAEDPHPPEGV
jgi:hypothetical protein